MAQEASYGVCVYDIMIMVIFLCSLLFLLPGL